MVEELVVKSISLRVGDALYEAMRKAAEDENRSLSNWIATTCTRAIADKQRATEDDERK